MECFSDSEINLILTKLANSKQPSFYSENLQRHKITPYSYRQDLILKLKNLYNTFYYAQPFKHILLRCVIS